MAQVKGSALISRVEYIKEKYGESGYQNLYASLSPLSRKFLDDIVLAQEWLPYNVFIDVNVKADQLFGKGDLQLCKEMGRYGADKKLTTLYKMFYRLSSVGFILSRAAALWRVHYDLGKMSVEKVNPGRALLRIEGFEGLHRAHCLSVLGWAHRSIELSGGKNVTSHINSIDDSTCEMVFIWR